MADGPRKPAFEVVSDEEPASQPKHDAGMAMLILGLKALSQRTLVAVSNLFTLATVASAFWLWMSIRNPDPYQLVELAMYGVFVLAANWIVRR